MGNLPEHVKKELVDRRDRLESEIDKIDIELSKYPKGSQQHNELINKRAGLKEKVADTNKALNG